MVMYQAELSGLQMKSIKAAKLLKLSDSILEMVTLLVEGEVIECFVSYCPYDLEVGGIYNVELSLNLSQSYEVRKAEPTETRAVKIGRGFSYYLFGNLDDEVFQTFTSLFDEDVHYDHPDLNNKFICLEVERIDACFF